ncbi:MAG: lipid-A-disaccharide synthase [Bdellovibrionales bacterium]
MTAVPVFYLIAGETSGDLLGVRLMSALKTKLNGNVRFTGIGGPLMQAEGLDLLFPHTELMHFGIFEVLLHIPRLLNLIEQTVDDIISKQPEAVITIDAPDFCFRVAERVKKRENETIHLIHYVAPTVWAWRPWRAKKIARFLDHLLAVLPFEPPYFTRVGLNCTFVGHSIIESGAASGDGAAFRSVHNIPPDVPLLAVLPGSRNGEISRLLPIFRDTVRVLKTRHPNLQIVVPTLPHVISRVAAEVATWGLPAHIVESEKDKFDAFAASNAALACSGTVALELALAQLPSVIAYKVHPLSYYILKLLVLAKYANLVNIIHNEPIVPEYLQNNCTPEKLAPAIDVLLSNEEVRQRQITKLSETAKELGLGQFVPSERAAEAILNVTRPPAVLQVLPALVTGGVERGTVETTAALVKAGFRAFVASSGGPMARDVEEAGGTHVTLPVASKNPVTMLLNAFRLARLIRERKINIVHVRSRAPAWSAWLASLLSGAKFVTTFHNAYGAATPLKRLYNSAMAKGERVIAISEFVADYAVRTYGVSQDILSIVSRGVDVEAFDPRKIDPSRVNALRQAWGITDVNRPVILLPARLTRWKGHLVLIRALERLKRRDFFCIIVGGGKNTPYGHEVARAIKQAGLENNVAIFDTCPDMPAAYLLADIVVVPSTRPEGFGRVVIEAQAMGVPVIASNHGGAKETVLQSKTGWLTQPGDDEDLARTIEIVFLLPPEKRQALAEGARAHICAHFTTTAMTSKTLSIYRELLHSSPHVLSRK